jgi:hypothetical protein
MSGAPRWPKGHLSFFKSGATGIEDMKNFNGKDGLTPTYGNNEEKIFPYICIR